MTDRIGEYSLLTKMRTAGSGSARWCIAMRGTERFFLKQFLSPVYPAATDTPIQKKQKERCKRFERRKQRLYSAMSCVIGDTLVPVLDFFRCEGHYYAASEEVSTTRTGENTDGLSEKQKRQVLLDLALCLQRLHLQGIVHADLKPEHVLLAPAGMDYLVRLIDLDSGFLVDDPPPEGSGLEGDPVYLSPEAFLRMTGQPVEMTTALDTFAFGAMIHRIWTGELPGFDAAKYHYLYETVLDGETPVLSGGLPRELRQMIQRMLSADPASRPDDAEVVRVLSETLTPQPTWPETGEEPLNGLSRFMKHPGRLGTGKA